MANLKGLMKDTAIYGLSSILGRFLNYLLTPLYTYYMPKASGEYGVSVNMYAYSALVLVILTFGMETTLFRFANKEGEKADNVFSMAMVVVGSLSVLFLTAVLLFIIPICDVLGYADHPEYVQIMAMVMALDAVKALPFSYLRLKQKAKKFAVLQLSNILLSIALNVFFFMVLHRTEVFYVFAINLLCSALMTLIFVPDLLRIKWHFDFSLLRRMLSYSWPMLLLGIAGILNQAADKIIYPLMFPDRMAELGEYGACVKVAMIMAMITQAFRFAYEPIVFSKSKDRDQNEYNALAMKYFILFTLVAFLGVMSCIDVLKLLVGPDYWPGLRVVPIVMVAEIMMGVYFNLSFWYKLIDKTYWGAVFSGIGCLVLIAFNVLLIPHFGYMACAWGGVAGYGVCMLLSYFVGQHYCPIRYDLKSIGLHLLLAGAIYAVMVFLPLEGVLSVAVKVLMVLAFLGFIYKYNVRA